MNKKQILYKKTVRDAGDILQPVTLLLNSSWTNIVISLRISPLMWSTDPMTFALMNCAGPATSLPNPSPPSDLVALLFDHKKVLHSLLTISELTNEKVLLSKTGHPTEIFAVGDAKMAPPPPPRATFDWKYVSRISTVGAPAVNIAPINAGTQSTCQTIHLSMICKHANKFISLT